MSSLIAGKRIAFTGAFYKMSRKEATEKATAVGAIVAPSFNPKSCDFLVTGGASSENSSKMGKAQQSGTQVIAESDFFQALGMPVPQYDPAEFKTSARRGGPRKTKAYPADAFGVAPTTPAAQQMQMPIQQVTPVVPAASPVVEAQAEAVVQPDGTLVEPVVPAAAPTAMPTAAAPVMPDATAPKKRAPRGPRQPVAPLANAPAPAAVEMTTEGTIKLTGKTVVFTGRLANLTRLTAATLVHRMGGAVAGSISAKTDLLVCGSGAGLKQQKAQASGIPTISEDDFVAACANSQQPVAAPTPTPATPAAE